LQRRKAVLGVLPIVDRDKTPKHTIFLAIDGGRYDYLERVSTPNIDSLIHDGVCYRNAVAGTCIAGTNPGLATLSTGLHVKDHGICSSYEWYDKKTDKLIYFYDAEKDILHMDAPTLGDFLKRKNPGARVGSISTKDRHALLLAGKQADIIAYSYREAVFKRDVMDAYTGAGVSPDYYSWQERVHHSLPPYLKDIKQGRRVVWEGKTFRHVAVDVADTSLIDEFIMDSALKVLENERLDLFFIGLVSPNITAHAYGTHSAELEDSVEVIDTQIGRLVEKLKDMGWFEDTLIVIASDHGMSERPLGVDVITALGKARHNDIVGNVLYLSSGGTGGFYLKDTSSSMVQRTIGALKEIDYVKEAWYRDDPQAPWYVRRFAHERSPDIVIIPDFNAVILDEGKKVPTFPVYHGPPYPPDLSIWLIFSGTGVKKVGKVGETLDYSSRETISDKEVEILPEQGDVVKTIRAIWGMGG
jgi:predicted AlkP superfamily pyrophosphatase or phosphodiesterase